MGHVDRRGPLGAQERTHVDGEPIAQVAVQGAEGLIEQEQPGPGSQCPGERDPLRLSPGEGRDIAALESREPDELEQLGDALLPSL